MIVWKTSACDIRSKSEDLTCNMAELLCGQDNLMLAMPKQNSAVYDCSLTTTR